MSQLGRGGLLAVFALSLSCTYLSPSEGRLLPSAESTVAPPCTGDAQACASEDGGVAEDAASADAGPISFKNDIRPIMNRHADDPAGPGCRDCHYNTSPMPLGIQAVGLDMTTLGSLRMGGATTGTNIVIPFDPDGSGIVQKLRGTYPKGVRMPKSGPPYWTDAEIALMANWIAQGAVGQDDE